MKYLLIILLLFPIVLPFVFKYFRKYVPSDGESNVLSDWLGFFGAYIAALLTLIAALIIFNYQRMDSVRPFILVSKSDLNETYPDVVTYFLENKNISVNVETCKLNDPHRDDKFFLIRIKNIGQGAAMGIALYDSSERKAAMYIRSMKIFKTYDLTALEVGGSFEFLFDFDLNKKYKVHKDNPNVITETLCLSYKDIYGNKYQQNILFEYDKSSKKGGLGNID